VIYQIVAKPVKKDGDPVRWKEDQKRKELTTLSFQNILSPYNETYSFINSAVINFPVLRDVHGLERRDKNGNIFQVPPSA